MRRAESIPPEVWSLFNAKLDGTLTHTDLARLERHLDGDFGLQTLYRNYCQLHINLDAEVRAQRAVDKVRVTQFNCREHAIHDDSVAEPGIANSHETKAQHRSANRVGWWTLAGCAATLLISIIWFSARNDGPQRTGWKAANIAEDSHLDIITVRLTSDESRYLPIGEVGNIHIQGPAHLDLIGTSRARLYDGRIKVRITSPQGRGFVVETPQGNVTDLGTEFGVDVAKGSNTGVVVFEGEVDLAVPKEGAKGVQVERLVQGEGLNVSEAGGVKRIMTIVTGKVSTFQQLGETRPNGIRPIIVDVFDNIPELRKFYEIVPGGLHEDALAYVDRPAHDWSGIDARGIPEYLIGADYVKPFNSDKMRSDVEISVTLSCPARLFVFADDRVAPPKWLRESFRDTGDDIGHDCGPYVLKDVEFFKLKRGIGPGNSIDSRCSIWERTVARPGTVVLGPNSGSSILTTMYGIAAIRLTPEISIDNGPQSKAAQPSGIGAAK